MLREMFMSAHLVGSWGLRDAIPTLLDIRPNSPVVRVRRNGYTLRLMRNDKFTDTVASLLQLDDLQGLAEIVGKEDDVVLDAGANSGLFSMFVKRRHPGARVIAIEANPRLVPVVRQNLAPFENWDVVPKALTNGEGTVKFYRNNDLPQASALTQASAASFGSAVEEISVESTSIDALAEEFALDTIDVLKMDIQGAEKSAIAGAIRTLPRIRKLLIEVSFLDPRPETMLAQLHEEFGDPKVVHLVSGGADLLYTRA